MADCRICKHNYKPSSCEPKCNRMCDGESDFEPITNADRIRAMSDEELAQFLCEISDCKPDYCPAYRDCIEKKDSNMRIWLQSEAEQKGE